MIFICKGDRFKFWSDMHVYNEASKIATELKIIVLKTEDTFW